MGAGPWGGLSCGLGSGDPGSPELKRELRFGRNMSLLLSKSSQTAEGRKRMLGQAWAGLGRFWVMENGSSGGACLDICRYLQLSQTARGCKRVRGQARARLGRLLGDGERAAVAELV